MTLKYSDTYLSWNSALETNTTKGTEKISFRCASECFHIKINNFKNSLLPKFFQKVNHKLSGSHVQKKKKKKKNVRRLQQAKRTYTNLLKKVPS